MPMRYQRPYPEEFRREAVRLVEVTGRSVREVAAELGVSTEGLRNWVKQARADRGELPEVASSDEREELRQLRRRVRELEQEREILKRATAFFARESDRR